jgi:hypothetical protein
VASKLTYRATPWERGTSENTNGLLREYFPKGTEITGDIRYLNAVANDLDAVAHLTLQARNVAAGNGASPSEPVVRSRKEDHHEGIGRLGGGAPK